MLRAREKSRGFTLVELLVVIAIIGILVSLLLPAVQAAREAARRMSCSNNLKQFGIALHNYHDVFKSFPYGHNAHDPGWLVSYGKGGHLVKLLPFLEQSPIYDQLDFSISTGTTGGFPPGGIDTQLSDLGYGHKSWGTINADQKDLSIFRCPSDTHRNAPTQSLSNYAMSMGNQSMPDGGRCPGLNGNDFGTGPAGLGDNGADQHGGQISGLVARFYWGARMADITDGTSNTIAMGEIRPLCGDHMFYFTWSSWNSIWAATVAPINWNTCANEQGSGGIGKNDATGGPEDCNHFRTWNMSQGFKSRHPGGAQFVFADGSVQFLPETIDYMTYQRLGDRRDGQPTGEY